MPLSCIKRSCPHYNAAPFFDPVASVVYSRFSCNLFPNAISCRGCTVCPRCGDLLCTCGRLSILIEVKTKGTVIETVPLQARVGE